MQSEVVVVSLLEKIYSELIRLKARVKIIDEKIGAPTTRQILADKSGSLQKEGESSVWKVVTCSIDRPIRMSNKMRM